MCFPIVCIADVPTVNKVGYYIPISLFAAVLISVGNGLISTFSPGTSTGKWIGYQILLGVGRGLGLQMVRLIFPIAHPTTHPLTFIPLRSQSSLFKTHYHLSNSPSPCHSSCSANPLVQHWVSALPKPFSPTVSRLSSPNTHLLLIPKASSIPGLLDSGRLLLKQNWLVY